MKALFEKSGAVAAPLGKNGEITEWLAVKERPDGRVRSMTMREAIEYHVKDVWQFEFDFLSPEHEAAHLMLALGYGGNVTHAAYQGTLSAENIVIPLEGIIHDVFDGRLVSKDDALAHFREEADTLFESMYGYALYQRTLMHEVVQQFRAHGNEASVGDVRESVGFSPHQMQKAANSMGISHDHSYTPLGKFEHFFVDGIAGKYSLQLTKDGYDAVLPPESEDFQIFRPHSGALQKQIFERVWPCIELMHVRRKNLEEVNDRKPFDLYAHIEMTELRDAMTGVPVPTPMPTIPVVPRQQTLPAPDFVAS